MDTLKISLTSLEQFRQFIEEKPIYLSHDKIVDGFKQGFQESQASINGSAAHKALEVGSDIFKGDAKNDYDICDIAWSETWPEERSYSVKTDLLSLNELQKIRDLYTKPTTIYEEKSKLFLESKGYRIRIGMRYDLTNTDHIVDFKCSKYAAGSKFGGSSAKYQGSLQWRTYLLASQKDFFHYHFIHVIKRAGTTAYVDNGACMFEADPMARIRLQDMVDRFVIFAEKYELIDYLIYNESLTTTDVKPITTNS